MVNIPIKNPSKGILILCLSGELAFLHGRCGVKPSVCVLGCDMGPGREEKLLRRHSLKHVPRHHLELAWRWPRFPSPRPVSAPGIGLLCLLHCRQILYQLSFQGSLRGLQLAGGLHKTHQGILTPTGPFLVGPATLQGEVKGLLLGDILC